VANILIVEDEKSSRLSIARMIELMGRRPLLAGNGREALDVLDDDQDVDLVITDVSMPEMDGRELVRRIREDRRYKRLPILIISGVVGPREIASALAGGATAFLPKPVKAADLREYVERYLA
jgi:CheY-like chemotaxis protein